jgi:hypothetical protein
MNLNSKNEVAIEHLSEMLEGQVAVLSSGFLSSSESLKLLNVLRMSDLYRADQNSYMLYPNKELPRFTERNNIPEEEIKNSNLFQLLIKDHNREIIERDILGVYHFNGNFRNADSLLAALNNLDDHYSELVEAEKKQLLASFEKVFHHKSFTGRSGTFYGYEGLGSIYWHMVSKLLIAVQECCLNARENKEDEIVAKGLSEHFHSVKDGIGAHKSPELYGAFPTDPYSHTPGGKGAQQPGMTGQVKEDIIARFGELGIGVEEGKISFNPFLLKMDEFIMESVNFHYCDIHSNPKELMLATNSLCFTYCQVPIVYQISAQEGIEVLFNDGRSKKFDSLTLDKETTYTLFQRDGSINQIKVKIEEGKLMSSLSLE